MILACRQLHKAYGIDVILEKITFHIEEREKAAIVGVNGAGKTTLFKVLTGEISADGGEFYLKKDASLGYLAQNIQIDSHRTIYEEMLSLFEKIIQKCIYLSVYHAFIFYDLHFSKEKTHCILHFSKAKISISLHFSKAKTCFFLHFSKI